MAAKNGSRKQLVLISWILLLLANHSLVNCGVCDVSDALRIDCGFHGIDETACNSRGCCWKVANDPAKNIPWCFNESATTPSSHQIPVLSTSIRVSPSQSITMTKRTSVSQSKSQHTLIPVSSSSKHNYRTVASNSMTITSTEITRSSIIESVTTVSRPKMPLQSSKCSLNHKITPDDGKSAMKIKKKDRIILGLSIVIAVMSVVIAFLILLKVCKKQSAENKTKGSEDSGMNYKDLKAKSDKSSTNDDLVLENENPYYVSA